MRRSATLAWRRSLLHASPRHAAARRARDAAGKPACNAERRSRHHAVDPRGGPDSRRRGSGASAGAPPLTHSARKENSPSQGVGSEKGLLRGVRVGPSGRGVAGEREGRGFGAGGDAPWAWRDGSRGVSVGSGSCRGSARAAARVEYLGDGGGSATAARTVSPGRRFRVSAVSYKTPSVNPAREALGQPTPLGFPSRRARARSG